MQLATQAVSSRLMRDHQLRAELLRLQTQYLVSAAYASTGGKGAQSAAKAAAKSVKFLPDKKRPKKTQPIPFERAVAMFGEPLIPPEEV